MEELEAHKDFMMALLIVSTTLLAIAPIFFGIIGVSIRESKKEKHYHLYLRALYLSFVFGWGCLIINLSWFYAPINAPISVALDLTVGFFAIQGAAFFFGSTYYWIDRMRELRTGSEKEDN